MRRAVCLAFFLSMAFAGSAQAATLNISPSGSDSAACTAAAPCKTFARAYSLAANGDVVSVAAGRYTGDHVVQGNKAVTFRGVAGNRVDHLNIEASNTTWDGVNVDANGVTPNGSALYISGSNITFKNASVGNVADEKGLLITGGNHTIDNVVFHDAVMTSAGAAAGVHMECVYAIGVPNFTIRNSTFRDCSVMDLFFTYGSWWSPQPPAYGNVTIENNVFAHPERENNSGWHYYSLYIGWIGPRGDSDPLANWVVRNNSFESSSSVGTDNRVATNSRWVGNLGSWDCVSGMTYRFNVGHACSGQDKAVSPDSSNGTTTAAFGWKNPRAYDFHLNSGSPAIGAADPSDFPATDRDGKARTGTPDAGAYEF